MRVRRFTLTDQLTHVWLIVTFMVLAVTGAGRLYETTDWGRQLTVLFGGPEQALLVHIWAGWLMTGGFVVHLIVLFSRVDWSRPGRSLTGPDSLLPVGRDVREFGRRLIWFLGIGKGARFERWTYWEKFDYWAVFWGLPLLFATGFILIYPVEASRILPGWLLNIALLLHRAEAILAVGYIVIFHLLIGHFRRSTFPLNEAMFAGSVELEELEEEKPEWVARLRREGRLEQLSAAPPATWFRVVYILFAYAVIALGLYLLIFGGYYSRFVQLH